LIKLSIKKYSKLGVLGGTFDPPHKGHLHISKIALKKFKLDKLFWVVTRKNLFKGRPYLDKKIRIKLSKKITEKERKIHVQYLDDKVKSINTFDLLNYIRRKNKNIKIYFLIGADNLIQFHKWHNWEQIPKLARIVVFSRQNYTTKALNSIASKKLKKKDWIYINSKKINISSSLIRRFW